jgi:hypothetical protein
MTALEFVSLTVVILVVATRFTMLLAHQSRDAQ